MKTCPSCNSQYSDDTLVYCLQDGTQLVGASGRDTPTVVMGESETVTRGVQWQPSQVTQAATARPQGKGAHTVIAVVLTVIGMLFLLGIAGIAAWIFLKDPNGKGTNVNNANLPGVTNIVPAPSRPPVVSPAPTASLNGQPTPTRTPSTPDPTEEEGRRREVSQLVDRWRSSLASRDLSALMNNYAPTLNYFNRRNASAGYVRSDKARAFALYNSMQVDVSNMAISVGPSGDTATATFDKEWVFTGRDTNAGKVRSQLELKKIDGRWLITGERDVRVYYTR